MKNITLKMEKAFRCTPLFIFLFYSLAFSQTAWQIQGAGQTFSFDLKYGATTTATEDSVITIDCDLQYGDVFEIWLKKDTSSVHDSLYVLSGAREVGGQMPPDSEIYWGGNSALRDSAWDVVNLMVNTYTGTHYFLNEPLADILKIGIANTRGTRPNRRIECIIKTKKTQTTQ